MPTASATTAGLFSVLVAVVAVLVVLGFRSSGVRGWQALGVLIVWIGIPGFLAWRGVLDRYDPLPPPALLLLLGLTVLTIGFVLSGVGARLAAGISLGAVVAFQAFRIPVELLLHGLYVEGIVPVQMTYAGRNFDVVTGISGLLLGLWLLSRKPVPRGVVVLWNLVGLALLVNIVAIAVVSTPVPFRRFVDSSPHTLPSTFPFIWLPSFLVQVALGSHLLIFRQLARVTTNGDSTARRQPR
jgi:hypothetical protein